MRKIILHFAVTLDGMVSNVEQWVALPDEALIDSNAVQERTGAIIFGKNSYLPLVGYWQNAETSSNSAAERAFAKSLNEIHKYVLSHGEVELSWNNSELLRVKDAEELKQAVGRLKNTPGMDIWVDAGEGALRSFLENDLWDGIDMLVHPLFKGSGKPLFASIPAKTPLKLVHSKTYANGLMNVRYEKA
jgi:dihydrofolate reductase